MSQKPVIIGGGSHARSLVAMAPEHLRPEEYVDIELSMPLKWLGNDSDFLSNPEYADKPVVMGYVAPADYNMQPRRRIIEQYAEREFATLVSPSAVVMPDSVIGKGSQIFCNAVVNTGAFLGDHVVVNTGAIVEHDAVVGENTFIGPGAVLCGGVTIGKDVYIGARAVIRNGVNVADGITVGIGCVVIRDLTVPGTYFGNPARRLI